MSGPPPFGYCTTCLDVMWNARRNEYGGRFSIVVWDDPDHDDGAGHEVISAGFAIDAYERGATVRVNGEHLRMRADVTYPEPQCANHHRVNEPTHAQRAMRPWRPGQL